MQEAGTVEAGLTGHAGFYRIALRGVKLVDYCTPSLVSSFAEAVKRALDLGVSLNLVGVVTAIGAKTAHSAVVLLDNKPAPIPLVTGLVDAFGAPLNELPSVIQTGAELLLNGSEGWVEVLTPGPAARRTAGAKAARKSA